MRIAVDANGADLGPAEVLAGAGLAAADGDLTCVVFGPAAAMGEPARGVEVVDAPLSIAKAPEPAGAVRSSPDASIVRAARAVGEGSCDALVSGGSTGAALAAAVSHVRRAKGIHRPALAVPVPVPGAPVTLLDAGANVEVRPEHLVQFAFMGAALAETVLGVEAPRVGLLSNGEESSRGRPETVEAHATLRERLGERFAGNVEGTGLTSGAADVVVADGFAGNVALKTMEGTSAALLGAVRSAALSSPRAKAGGLLLRPALRALRDQLDPERVGGAYLLGLRRLAVVPHGRFTRAGFAQAIRLAARGTREDVTGRTHAALEAAGALRVRRAVGAGTGGS